MTKQIICLFIFIFSFGHFFVSKGQQNSDLISVDFGNSSFQKWVEQVEQSTKYRFYFKKEDIDSLVLHVEIKELKIHEALEKIFKQTEFTFAIDDQSHIFIVKGRDLQRELPVDFFYRGTNVEGSINTTFLDYLDTDTNAENQANRIEVFEIGTKSKTIGTGNATITGIVRATESGEPLIGVNVFISNPTIGVATDLLGYYSLTLPKGKHELNIQSIGRKSVKQQVILYSEGKLDLELQEDVTSLKEIVIQSDRDLNVSGMQMGFTKLDIQTLKNVPVALGEVDVFRVLLALPGVQSVGEGASGLNVRGGATDQNLILFNDATLFNPTHLFGFFSAFNADAIKNIELYKSGIPADLGGRLSSVLEVNNREGNKKKFAGSGGIGLVTGRLTLEGPLIKEKTSFIISTRSTYSDWLLKRIPNKALNRSSASFYDLGIGINHEINSKNLIDLTAYTSHDQFKLNGDTLYQYNNINAALKWKHIFGDKFYSSFTTSYSSYDYTFESDKVPVNAFTMFYKISQPGFKMDFNYSPNAKHNVGFGASVVYYSLAPGNFMPKGEESLIIPDVLQEEQGYESVVYLGDQFTINPKLSVYGGIRYSIFNYLGGRDVFTYKENLPRTEESIIDTVSYGTGKSIVSYGAPEYRISANYTLSVNSSIKFSYNRLRQYIQTLSNTTAISPTDIWKLSDPYIKPQVGDQFAIGFYKNLKGNTIETSVEGYYKSSQNSLDYKGGATLLLNPHLETDVVSASGKSYGVELLIKKATGKVNGWMSYTYSRSFLRTESEFPSEMVNNGKYYPTNYDKPHAVNLTGNYKFSHRFSASLNITYSTGRPITLPLATYEVDGSTRVYYSERNQFRIPDYFRTDLSVNLEGNHKVKKLAHSSFTLGIYNLTGRKNAYSVFFVSSGGTIKGYRLSIFGNLIPTITYNFKF